MPPRVSQNVTASLEKHIFHATFTTHGYVLCTDGIYFSFPFNVFRHCRGPSSLFVRGYKWRVLAWPWKSILCTVDAHRRHGVLNDCGALTTRTTRTERASVLKEKNMKKKKKTEINISSITCPTFVFRTTLVTLSLSLFHTASIQVAPGTVRPSRTRLSPTTGRIPGRARCCRHNDRFFFSRKLSFQKH